MTGQISARQLMQPPSELNRFARAESAGRSLYEFCFLLWVLLFGEGCSGYEELRFVGHVAEIVGGWG